VSEGGVMAAASFWRGLTPPYATIVVDPPWEYPEGFNGWGKRRRLPYSSMTIEEIAALPVADLARPGAHLYLWTTARYLWDARRIVEAWGFAARNSHVEVLVWCKEPMGLGLGRAFAPTTEFVLYARRPIGAAIKAARIAAGLSAKEVCAALGAHGAVNHGGAVSNWEADNSFPNQRDWDGLRRLLPTLAHLPDLAADPIRQDSTWWRWKRGPHSAKPPAFLDLVERVSPAPRVELFARDQRLGWDSWGRGYEYAV
jgi:N6-adenosine-specific RNA methylase IME4